MRLFDSAICNKKGAVSRRNSPSVGILLKMKGKNYSAVYGSRAI